MSNQAQPPSSNPPGRTFQEYFNTLASTYARSTGNSTYKLLSTYLSQTNPPIVDINSIINDNACGPGTATSAIIAYLRGQEPARIEATDSNPAMVDAAKALIAGRGWKNVRASNEDSHGLGFEDGTFTVSVSNVNANTYEDAGGCLREMYRTLKPGGVVVVSMWKRFGFAELLNGAQRRVSEGRGMELIRVPREEFMGEGYLEGRVREAGFRDVGVEVVRVVSEGEEVEGLREFMVGEFTRVARERWTEREREEWPGVVEGVFREEVERNGGVGFEAWVVTGRK
ncbi:MAG: hypothetical protein Q9160_005579 [Pyrenula sp. 1 TL-2023]